MATSEKPGFRYLNGEGRWPGFHWAGLQLDGSGALSLAKLPARSGPPDPSLAALPAPEMPGGIAVASDGTVFYSMPQADRLYRIDGCRGEVSTVPCLAPGGSGPTSLRRPRGLWLSRSRGALFVADAGNGRVLLLDVVTAMPIEIWHGPDLNQRFQEPWSIAGRGDAIYVVDAGARKVYRFDELGQADSAFTAAVLAAGVTAPAEIAVDGPTGTPWLFVLDRSRNAVAVLHPDGTPVLDGGGAPLWVGVGDLTAPSGLAAHEGTLYVGDNARRRVLVQAWSEGRYGRVGDAVGYEGPISAMAVDGSGALLVHAGTPSAPVRLDSGAGRVRRGVLWSGAVPARGKVVSWGRLTASVGEIPEGAHLQLFAATGSDPAHPPGPPDPASETPFTDPRWRVLPLDVADVFVGEASAYLWVGAVFSSSGWSSAVLSQIRAEWNQPSYLPYLPALYRRGGADEEFLLRLLSSFESFFAEAEAESDRLPALFEPSAAPPERLRWLASWLAIDWEERWGEALQRTVIDGAFAADGWRGTAQGLRAALRLLEGIDAAIVEPLAEAAWWGLPEEPKEPCACGGGREAGNGRCACGCSSPSGAGAQGKPSSRVGAPACGCGRGVSAGTAGSSRTVGRGAETSVLGVTTMLASGMPQGAVVGTSAVLGQSKLIGGDQLGAPLFEDLAFRFSVLVRRSDLRGEEHLARLRALIEREKPAHTAFELCVIEPAMRVGYQARVGIDAVVGGPRAPARLDEPASGIGLTLGGPAPGEIGVNSRVGETTRIG